MEKWFDKKFKLGLGDNQLKELLERLTGTPSKIEYLVKGLPEDLLNNKPDGKWSIKENIGHLIDLEELHSGRIDDFIEGKETLRPADLQNKKTDASDHNKQDVTNLISELKKVRSDLISRLNSLNKEILSRKAIHPRLKQEMRTVDMTYFVVEHDEHHINTIKELIKKIP